MDKLTILILENSLVMHIFLIRSRWTNCRISGCKILWIGVVIFWVSIMAGNGAQIRLNSACLSPEYYA